MPELAIHNTQLYYTQAGEGETLVFVHGSLDDYRSWRLQVGPFSRHFRVVAYSRRYHYPNPLEGDGLDYSAALHAQDLAGLIRALAPGAVHLVTSSYGGCVALSLAVTQPDLVRTLVLAEPPLMPWLEALPAGAPLAQDFNHRAWDPARMAFAAGDLARGAQLFLDGVMGRPTFEYLSAQGRGLILDNAPEMRAETLSPFFYAAVTPAQVIRIACPVLLLDGELSPRMFYLITEELERCLPHTERFTIPGASHAMHLGNARAYNQAVLDFLARHSPSRMEQNG